MKWGILLLGADKVLISEFDVWKNTRDDTDTFMYCKIDALIGMFLNRNFCKHCFVIHFGFCVRRCCWLPIFVIVFFLTGTCSSE